MKVIRLRVIAEKNLRTRFAEGRGEVLRVGLLARDEHRSSRLRRTMVKRFVGCSDGEN